MNDEVQWLLVLGEIGLLLYGLFTAATILIERRRPTATLTWILVLVFLPPVGLLAYWLIGRRKVRRSQRARRRQQLRPTEATAAMAKLDESPLDLSPQLRGLIHLALRRSAAPVRRADEVELLAVPHEAFATMEAAIAAAQHRIHVLFYIWRDDATGERMLDLLCERARAGVKVRLMYDDFGAIGTPLRHFNKLEQAGGEVARFAPLRVRLAWRRGRLDFRNHRKLLCIDGRIGFTGGLNVADEYRGTTRSGRIWSDLWLRMTGDAVIGLEAVFVDDWLSATEELIELWSDLPEFDDRPNLSMAARPSTPMRSTGPLVQVIPSGPDQRPSRFGDDNVSVIAASFVAAIGCALERVWIATPYFIPDDALTQVLCATALRGVDVEILVPNLHDNDNRLVALAARSYYDTLLDAGCTIYEYRPGMLHAKYMVIDETLAVIGSANMDVRSLYLNYEVTTMFYDRGVASDLAEVFVRDRGLGLAIDVEQRLRASLGDRLKEGLARILSPLL
ncbi:cardiolipin synthase [Nannocystaceae bacterium ST9]